jgi:hypothetical protein
LNSSAKDTVTTLERTIIDCITRPLDDDFAVMALRLL